MAVCDWCGGDVGAWEQGLLAQMTEADFVLWTQRCLQLLHGNLSAPFAVPDDDLYAVDDATGLDT